MLSAAPPSLLVAAKMLVHWLATALPLIIVAPLLAEMLHLPRHALPALLASLLLGTPALCLIGAIGAALTLATRRSGVLLALLVLPLYVPILIFGAGAVRAATLGLDPSAQLLWLAAISLLAAALAPITIVAALTSKPKLTACLFRFSVWFQPAYSAVSPRCYQSADGISENFGCSRSTREGKKQLFILLT